MRAIAASCLVILASVASGAAQTTSPPETLEGRTPAYSITTFRELVQLCASDKDDPTFVAKVGLCAGYLSGVLDASEADGRRHRRICLPPNAPNRLGALQALVSWDQSHPQYDNEPAAKGVMRYYMDSYPCQRSAGKRSRKRG